MGCDWAALVAKDRCKAIGVPWSDAELNAIYQLKIPAKFVRNGCITIDDYQNELNVLSGIERNGNEKPVRYMNKAELQKKAGELGIQFTPDATNITLRDLIQCYLERSKLPKE